MKVSELLDRFSFHDGCVNGIAYADGEVRMSVDMRMYDQASYEDGDAETREAVVTFHDVKGYTWEWDKRSEEELDHDTILELNETDAGVEIILLDEEAHMKSKATLITFSCSDVSMEYVV